MMSTAQAHPKLEKGTTVEVWPVNGKAITTTYNGAKRILLAFDREPGKQFNVPYVLRRYNRWVAGERVTTWRYEVDTAASKALQA